jgi:hypothetical protein
LLFALVQRMRLVHNQVHIAIAAVTDHHSSNIESTDCIMQCRVSMGHLQRHDHWVVI